MCREYKFNISCTKGHSVCCIATGIYCRKTIWNFFFFFTCQATINPSLPEKQNIHGITITLVTKLTKMLSPTLTLFYIKMILYIYMVVGYGAAERKFIATVHMASNILIL